MKSRKNKSFAKQENLDAEVDLGKEPLKIHEKRRFSHGIQGPELPDTFSWTQNNSCEEFRTSPEVCQSDSRPLGITSAGSNGLTSIGLAYSSSDESEVEIEFENESVNDHKEPTVSQSDSVICNAVCSNSSQLDSSSFDKADSAGTFHSTFTAKSCSGLFQNVSQTPRKETNNLDNSVFKENPGFSANQPDGATNLNVDDYLGHGQSSSSSRKLLPSSDRKTAVFITKGSCIEGSVSKATVVECELLDKVMTMLIRLRLSVARLSSGGHFPYSAAPLISLMESVEKCYDGC